MCNCDPETPGVFECKLNCACSCHRLRAENEALTARCELLNQRYQELFPAQRKVLDEYEAEAERLRDTLRELEEGRDARDVDAAAEAVAASGAAVSSKDSRDGE